MTAIRTRTQPCDAGGARKRLADARAYLDAAEDSDAAACQRLGLRPRSQNDKDAVDVLKLVSFPDAKAAANALARLIDLKGSAHHGVEKVSPQTRATARKHAQRVLALVEDVFP